MTDTVETPPPVSKRGANGRFVKGGQGGPGRPPGAIDFYSEMVAGLRKCEKKHRISIWDHAWERGLKDDNLLGKLLNKLVTDAPDQSKGLHIYNVICPPDWGSVGDALRLRASAANGHSVPAAPDPNQSA